MGEQSKPHTSGDSMGISIAHVHAVSRSLMHVHYIIVGGGGAVWRKEGEG